MQSNHGWRVNGVAARFNGAGLSFSLDASRPGEGWSHVTWQGQPVPLRMFALHISDELHPHPPLYAEWCENPAENYARDADLIVAYPELPTRRIASQLYWRGIEPLPNVCGVELIVSVQTELLASAPHAVARFAWNDATLWQRVAPQAWDAVTPRGGPGASAGENLPAALLLRPTHGDFSCALLVYPTDFRRATVRFGDRKSTVACELFTELLEKGVIRKGRMQGLFLPRQSDESLAEEALQLLSTSAPPLTA